MIFTIKKVKIGIYNRIDIAGDILALGIVPLVGQFLQAKKQKHRCAISQTSCWYSYSHVIIFINRKEKTDK